MLAVACQRQLMPLRMKAWLVSVDSGGRGRRRCHQLPDGIDAHEFPAFLPEFVDVVLKLQGAGN